MTLADNLARVQERIESACARAGRPAGEITLVAVTKFQPLAMVEEALASGLRDLGENYVQEAGEKQGLLQTSEARWHLIGHLQRNKAKAAVQLFDLVQSVDSVKLAQAIGQSAMAQGKTQEVLVQVHLGGEESKSGFAPEAALAAAEQIAGVPGIELRGLMGIAPAGEEARPYFRQLRTLFDALPAEYRHTLSMGMTGDFETAIDEGTTMIRIGTALFGPRTI